MLINDFIPLATIIGAAIAPTIAAVWAGRLADRNARAASIKVSEVKETLVESADATKAQLGEIHALVNNQLSEAVARFDLATKKIAGLEALVKKLQGEGGVALKRATEPQPYSGQRQRTIRGKTKSAADKNE